MEQSDDTTGLEIAVLGLACRFPGADGPEQYWENLRSGTESITFFTPGELAAQGVPEALRNDPDYVAAQGVLADADRFDADFFGMSPKEADLMDPQHRVLLRCAWEALEDAGHDPLAVPGPVGVYAGTYYNSYVDHVDGRIDGEDPGEVFARNLANEKDFLATRIAYKLDLSGPALTVQSACSTSLVAVHLACQALLSGACDTALAGGATVRAHQHQGYLFQPGGIFSADGHCRPFDATAQGTVAANGAGMVVLKRLEDALADGDPIRAVIKGSAVGNDGARRIGFTAPGVAGQARVIRAALDTADVDPATIGYVETHGSGTPLGDPIEIEALTRVFRGLAPGSCAIGAVKGNIGHTHAAAGVAGLIKTVLALQHRQIPPSLHFDVPNPAIDFDAVPFRVNTRLTDWPAGPGPRRAGVSSFGMGGTNAHVVLEEAPAPARREPGRARVLLPITARTATALEAATDRLADRLDGAGAPDLAGTARTLQTGRRHYGHRRFLIAESAAEAARALRERAPNAVRTGHHDGTPRQVAFVLPGLGEQRIGMGRELHATEPVFRAALDRCAEGFRPHLGIDLRELLHPVGAPDTTPTGPDLRRMLRGGPAAAERTELDRTRYAQPATFAVEYALARLWESWGVRPSALIGYSIGEYTAAHLAGVLSLDDALKLVAHRARLIDGLPAGAMLAVPMPEERVLALLDDGLSLAAVNGPALCVVAGTTEAVAALEARLAADGVAARQLQTTHAFHSHLMDPIVAEFAELAAGVTLHPPTVPYVSNVTGDWADADLVTDPAYWVRHLRRPVRFADGIGRLWQQPGRVLLETGPGQSLTSLALQLRPASAAPGVAVASMPGRFDRQGEERFLLNTAGGLWAAGVDLDWSAVSGGNSAARVALPPYPFEETRHWIDPAPRKAAPSLARRADLSDWFHTPVWESLPPRPATTAPAVGSWLLFSDEEGIGEALAARLRADGHRVTTVRAGRSWRELTDDSYELAPGSTADHRRLVERLTDGGGLPDRIVHLWSVGPRRPAEQTLERGFHSLLRLDQALTAAAAGAALDLTVVSSDAFAVLGTEPVAPEKATVTGPALVLPLEQPDTVCRAVDLSLPPGRGWTPEDTELLYAELLDEPARPLTALRGRRRWQRTHRPVRVEAAADGRTPLRENGVYLITGGFGGVGLSLARHFAAAVGARLVLVGRTALPPRESWDALLADDRRGGAAGERIRAVLELEGLGGQVMTAAADVTDSQAMHRIVDEAVRRFGAVHGIVHAAGVPAAGLAQLKTAEAADRVLDPKVRGGLVVDALARRLAPDFTVHCSSSLALTGGVGQIDYVAANAFLDALAQHNEAVGGPRTVSVNWDGWQEVGMAFRTIGAGADRPADGRTGPVDHPLVDACLRDDEAVAVYSVALSVATSWLIDEHRMAGNAVVPGTGHLELARAVHEHQSGDARAVLEEVTFLSPVVIGEDQQRELRVVLDKRHTPPRFAVISRETGAAGATGAGLAEEDGWQVHVTGSVGPVGEDTAPRRRHDVAELIARAGMRDLGAVAHTGPMGFGPRSRCLRRVHLGEKEALAELELPAEFGEDLERIALHPSLLDLGAGFHGMNLAEEFRIPLSYGRLTLLAPLPRRIYSHHRFHEADRRGKETFTADFTLLDETGLETVRVEDFVLKRVADLETRLEALRDGTSRETAAYRFPPAATTAPGRPGEAGPLRDHLDQGIRPAEGVEALLRLLAAGLGPQVAVVAKDLDAVFADIRAHRVGAPADGPADDTAVHPRPGILTAYTEPRDDTETALARLWAELLGLERVGVHDEFFELGGHSLLGLQLAARIRRRFGVDLPLNALFETLTVAEQAAALRRRLDTEPTIGAAGETPPAEQKRSTADV